MRSARSVISHMLPRALVVRQLDRSAGSSVLLTFDDGPHPEVTPAVLDRLDAHGARAVFFVIGRRIRKAAHLMREIQDRGHLIGHHSYLHRTRYVLNGGPGFTFGEYYRDFRRGRAVIERHATGSRRLFRPPGGRITPTTLVVPRCFGYRCVTWSIDVGDWKFRTAADSLAGAAELVRKVAARDVILLHDNNPCVLQILDHLLPALRSRQFDLASGINHL